MRKIVHKKKWLSCWQRGVMMSHPFSKQDKVSIVQLPLTRDKLFGFNEPGDCLTSACCVCCIVCVCNYIMVIQEPHAQVMQHTRTSHKAVTGRFDTKKLISCQRQSDYSWYHCRLQWQLGNREFYNVMYTPYTKLWPCWYSFHTYHLYTKENQHCRFWSLLTKDYPSMRIFRKKSCFLAKIYAFTFLFRWLWAFFKQDFLLLCYSFSCLITWKANTCKHTRLSFHTCQYTQKATNRVDFGACIVTRDDITWKLSIPADIVVVVFSDNFLLAIWLLCCPGCQFA